jgi:uncharacterized membrane protein
MSAISNFISSQDEAEIVTAIKQAELNTSGEIRVHIEHASPEDAFERAKVVFHELKMDRTKLENGVLIYLATACKSFAICGDKGINEVVPDDFWDSTRDAMQTQFRKGNFKQGLIDGITKAGEQLKIHFPWQNDDKNELPDAISKG